MRFRGAWGGRGSAKSVSFATMALIFASTDKLKILCCREHQNSIKESFHAELIAALARYPWLQWQYDVGVDYLRCKTTGSEFLFKGLYNNLESVKSIANVDICIVEEAETISEKAWRVLIPTIRKPLSELWIIWNPGDEESPTHQRFRVNPPPRSIFLEMNWRDNPFFPAELNEQRLHEKETMPYEVYLHVWEGHFLIATEAQIFHEKFKIENFEIDDSFGHPLHGLDWGFASDPTAIVQCYIKDKNLYIRREAGKTRLELDDTAPYAKKKIPGIEKYVLPCDCARPESVSYLKNHGLPLAKSCTKWPGSIEDGIAYLRNFKMIYIHPSCTQTAKNFAYYSYKVDKRTDESATCNNRQA